MQSICLDSDGVKTTTVTIDQEWTVTLDGKSLRLIAILPQLIYLFSPSSSNNMVSQSVLPRIARELLIFAPCIPLLKTASGFQVFNNDAWGNLIGEDEVEQSTTHVESMEEDDEVLEHTSSNTSKSEDECSSSFS